MRMPPTKRNWLIWLGIVVVAAVVATIVKSNILDRITGPPLIVGGTMGGIAFVGLVAADVLSRKRD
jgi:hypothetical protein